VGRFVKAVGEKSGFRIASCAQMVKLTGKTKRNVKKPESKAALKERYVRILCAMMRDPHPQPMRNACFKHGVRNRKSSQAWRDDRVRNVISHSRGDDGDGDGRLVVLMLLIVVC